MLQRLQNVRLKALSHYFICRKYFQICSRAVCMIFLKNYATCEFHSAVCKIMTQSFQTNISQTLKHCIASLYPCSKLIDVWQFFHYGMFRVLTFSLLRYSQFKFCFFPHAVGLPKNALYIHRIWDATHTIF